MNLSALLAMLVALAKPMIAAYGPQAHSIVERWSTIPAKDREKLLAGMTDHDKAQAEVMLREIADKVSDVTVYIASRGSIAPD